jgi:uncharacterized protein
VRALALVVVLAAGAARAEAPIPPLGGAVVDTAGLLGGGDRARLEQLSRSARALDGGHGPQLQYLIIPPLDGEDIEGYSIRVAEAWKLGDPDRDNGVLVTVAVQDRNARIEVGNGIEGGLTDVQASRIIRSVLVPAFRQGAYGDGLYQVGVQVLAALGSLPSDVRPAQRVRPQTHVPALGVIAFFVIVLVLRAFSGFGPRRRRSMWWGGGPWMGGGGGGGFGGFGGGGGGGWSGGGGGFSGGGASGRW